MAATRIFAALALSAGLAVAQGSSPSNQPNDAEAHFLAGEKLESSGNVSAAETEYRKSLDLQAKNLSALGALAYLYSTQKRYPEAESSLRKFIEIDPQNAKAHVQLATVLFASDKKENGAKELTSAAHLAPRDTALLKQVAQLYIEHDLYAEAASSFETVIGIDSSDAEAHHGYGVLLLQQRKFDPALEQLRRAVILKRDLKEAYGDLAVAAAEVGDFPQAITALDMRATYLPETAATYFLRATSYDHLKQFPLAADNYRKFLATDFGKSPNQEWQAKHRLLAIEKK